MDHMDGTTLFERITALLFVRQHLHPHEPLNVAIEHIGQRVDGGPCVDEVAANGQTSIGRLSREELVAIARQLTSAAHQRTMQTDAARHPSLAGYDMLTVRPPES